MAAGKTRDIHFYEWDPKQHHSLSFFRNFLENRLERSQDLFYQDLIYRSLMIGLSFWYIVIKIKGALNNFNFMHRLIRAFLTLPSRATYGHLTEVRARGEVNWHEALQGVEILNLAWVGWGIGVRGFKSFQWNTRVLVLEMKVWRLRVRFSEGMAPEKRSSKSWARFLKVC